MIELKKGPLENGKSLQENCKLSYYIHLSFIMGLNVLKTVDGIENDKDKKKKSKLLFLIEKISFPNKKLNNY